MDSQSIALAMAVLIAGAVLCAPMALAWLCLATFVRSGRREARTDLIAGFGCGLFAAGAAMAIGTAAEWAVGIPEPERLTRYVPLVEESLKLFGIVGALGLAALAGTRLRPLSLRRMLVATVAVVAAFAAGENLGHLGTQLLSGSALTAAELRELLRVRAVLPPLAHLAETWVAGAALWLASRCRARSPRAATVLLGLGLAGGIHALWNAAALAWWPDPWPLVAILAGSFGAAIAATVGMAHRQRREARAANAHEKVGELAGSARR